MNKGWISIHRELQDHWLWQEKRVFSKLEAWLDILLTVNHSEQKTMIKNRLFTVKRGESINSLDTWASRWNWNKSKVRRFLTLLESDSMVMTKSETQTTRLTVCKYDSYQDLRNANETQMKLKRNANETQTTPNNNDNNINKENKRENDFNIFWQSYPNKSNKKGCFNKFIKLKDKDVVKILETINDFVRYKPFTNYNHPNPMTYLNQERWNDEIKKEQLFNLGNMKVIGKTNQV